MSFVWLKFLEEGSEIMFAGGKRSKRMRRWELTRNAVRLYIPLARFFLARMARGMLLWCDHCGGAAWHRGPGEACSVCGNVPDRDIGALIPMEGPRG